MRKILLLLGILLEIFGVIGLLTALLFWYAGTHTLDASAALYHQQMRIMLLSLIIGILLIVAGIFCFIRRGKLPKK